MGKKKGKKGTDSAAEHNTKNEAAEKYVEQKVWIQYSDQLQ